MEVEAKHKPKVYSQKCEEVWKIIAQKNARNEAQWWVFISIIAVFTIFILANGSGFGYITGFVSFFGIGYLTIHRRKINNAKQKYIIEAEEISQKYIENNHSIRWRFGEDSFGYDDFQMSIKLNWGLFEKYEIVNEILFLFQGKDIQSAITIAKGEVGEENFNKIIDFVKTKIK